jgi:hypothetical protein
VPSATAAHQFFPTQEKHHEALRHRDGRRRSGNGSIEAKAKGWRVVSMKGRLEKIHPCASGTNLVTKRGTPTRKAVEEAMKKWRKPPHDSPAPPDCMMSSHMNK